MIWLPCPSCLMSFSVGDHEAGNSVSCPVCQSPVRVPGVPTASDTAQSKVESHAEPPDRPTTAAPIETRAVEVPLAHPAVEIPVARSAAVPVTPATGVLLTPVPPELAIPVAIPVPLEDETPIATPVEDDDEIPVAPVVDDLHDQSEDETDRLARKAARRLREERDERGKDGEKGRTRRREYDDEYRPRRKKSKKRSTRQLPDEGFCLIDQVPLDYVSQTNIGVGLGIILHLIGIIMLVNKNDFGLLLLLLGDIPYIWGCAAYAKNKGRTAWLGFVAVIGLLGLIILVAVPEKRS